MKYIPTIGLEIHSQIATETKIFCGCSTSFGSDPNTHSCPVCLGMPGVLPVLNRSAVELAVRMGILTGGEVQKKSYFARKNYFYPDLPKGYQVSMFEYPLIRGGSITVGPEGNQKVIRLNRIHMEEDAGKLIHGLSIGESHFDVNRCGVPLIEIVSEPDIDTIEETTEFLNTLKDILIFSGVSHGNMEQGNIRCDANISIRPEGQKELGTRTEIKNMNSFVNAAAAIKKEIERQIEHVENGGVIVQETLLYDADTDTLASMRSKEEAHDYRYFPEPDLVPIIMDDNWLAQIKADIPEMKNELRARFISDYSIPEYDADIITSTPGIAVYFENVINAGANPKKTSNWIMGEILRILNDKQIDLSEFKVTPVMLALLIGFVEDGTISGSIAKIVFDEMAETGRDPESIIKAKGLTQISDTTELKKIVREVIEGNPDECEKFRAGKKQLMGFFVGQVMNATKGKANPKEVNIILGKLLS